MERLFEGVQDEVGVRPPAGSPADDPRRERWRTLRGTNRSWRRSHNRKGGTDLTAIERPAADQFEHAGPATACRFFGPGLVTGASDDDPSGIATYSQAGAQFGYSLIWSLLFTYPLMCAIQMISAEIGRVTGGGCTANMRRYYSMWFLYPLVGLLIVANVINLGADLGAMAAAIGLLLPGPRWLFIAAFALVIAFMEVFMRYARYVSVLRWLPFPCSLMSEPCLPLACPGQRSRSTLSSHIHWTGSYITVLVAVFGTTISPYLFFWQASEEVDDEKEDPAAEPLLKEPGQAPRQLARIRLDRWSAWPRPISLRSSSC